ncbi:hypothetical protein CAOG_04041 [Capsaspora owczarzaki ATCC 30864]|uniref:Uncharacterized protein n=1 Tax=Capsaspora owczarzaki (strain ATCC 30864) TaxID=595528 RepID=A0A0D2VQY6_CAPO3|nr:hypothetical protein CAOG_04041 [Capsaspora owczarzaki ATCC 30864]KJE93222.1 hypothetical protein CAOG_004041 [Capsaspora owczarzaki ATCC 30864]|eukprot:XP_004347866.1 hypothetical protein CAOG_04041 [Capsaspora owczarzaki ATCC 30864]
MVFERLNFPRKTMMTLSPKAESMQQSQPSRLTEPSTSATRAPQLPASDEATLLDWVQSLRYFPIDLASFDNRNDHKWYLYSPIPDRQTGWALLGAVARRGETVPLRVVSNKMDSFSLAGKYKDGADIRVVLRRPGRLFTFFRDRHHLMALEGAVYFRVAEEEREFGRVAVYKTCLALNVSKGAEKTRCHNSPQNGRLVCHLAAHQSQEKYIGLADKSRAPALDSRAVASASDVKIEIPTTD